MKARNGSFQASIFVFDIKSQPCVLIATGALLPFWLSPQENSLAPQIKIKIKMSLNFLVVGLSIPLLGGIE